MLNRHFYIMVIGILFIGLIFWWQTPETAVSAMTKGEYLSNPYSTVKNYWKRMDYRQFDLAEEMVVEDAQESHNQLKQLLMDQPLLSIQKFSIGSGISNKSYSVKVTFGSVIDLQTSKEFEVGLESSPEGWFITSIKELKTD